MEENEIKIGTQTWTSKNLDVESYRNGDEIPQVKDKEEWANLTTGAWCYYKNKTAKGTTYGKLYNWFAVNDPRGLAPKGYHIPSDAEWTILTDNLGGEEEAGTKMKSTSDWDEDGNGTNTSGFAGLPGGFRSNNGDFDIVGWRGYWWSSSEYDTDLAWSRDLCGGTGDLGRGNVRVSSRPNSPAVREIIPYYGKQNGYSVRCLRD